MREHEKMLRSGRRLEACTSIAQNGVCSAVNLLVYGIGRYIDIFVTTCSDGCLV